MTKTSHLKKRLQVLLLGAVMASLSGCGLFQTNRTSGLFDSSETSSRAFRKDVQADPFPTAAEKGL